MVKPQPYIEIRQEKPELGGGWDWGGKDVREGLLQPGMWLVGFGQGGVEPDVMGLGPSGAGLCLGTAAGCRNIFIRPQAFLLIPFARGRGLAGWRHPWLWHQARLWECLLGGASGKEPACQCRRHNRHRFDPCVWKISWRRTWQPTPVFLPRESHG